MVQTVSRRDLYMILAGAALAVTLAGAAWGVSYVMEEDCTYLLAPWKDGQPDPYGSGMRVPCE